MKSRKRNVGEPQVAREPHFAHRCTNASNSTEKFIRAANGQFQKSVFIIDVMHSRDILHYHRWKSNINKQIQLNAAGLGLFSWITTLRRFCFSIFCIAVGPAFTFSDFDRVGGRGFAFDVFCATLLFLAT